MLLHGTDSLKKKKTTYFQLFKKKKWQNSSSDEIWDGFNVLSPKKKNIDSFLAAPAAFVVVWVG